MIARQAARPKSRSGPSATRSKKPDAPKDLFDRVKSTPGNLPVGILDWAFWRKEHMPDDAEVAALDRLETFKDKEPLKRLLIAHGLPLVADLIERRVPPLPLGPPRIAPYTKSKKAAMQMLAHQRVRDYIHEGGMSQKDALAKVADELDLDEVKLGNSYKRGDQSSGKRSKTSSKNR